jgi:murein DD-endopeptidase MepM/ murein hydrolase activator NlpD
MAGVLCWMFVLAAAPDVTVAARSIQPGEVLVVTVTAPASDAPVGVHAFGRDWPVYAVDKGRWRALVGIDLETRPGRYTVAVTSASGRADRPVDVQRHAFPTRRLTVDPDLVNPPPEALERIERDTRELQRIWTASSPDRLWTAFVRPVPDEANSAFGTRSIYNGQPRSPHTGADFLSPAGRPVQAPAGGRVVLADALYFTGNTVVIDHGMGLFSLLAHLSEVDAHTGETVAAGDVVGKVGATGRVTGPHLHWTVRLNGARVDPLSLLYVTRSAPDAEHEREQRRDRRHLADPEDERPAQRFDARGRELGADRGEPLVQRRVELLSQQTDLVRQPALESIRRGEQHVFTPVFLFRVERLDQSEGGVVAKLRSERSRYSSRGHKSTS